MKTKQLTVCAFGLACLIICSKISLPIGPVPVTLQTMAVVLLGFTCSNSSLRMIFGTYLLGGLCGLPFFAGGGGLSYILQPSFGFLCAFPLAALTISYTKNQLTYTVSMLLALFIIYIIGTLYMGMIFQVVLGMEKGFYELISIGVLPFVFNDVISGLLAVVITKRNSIVIQLTKLQTK